MEPRNPLGLVPERDFFLLRFYFFFKAGGSLSLLGGSVDQGSPLGEVYFVCRTLLCLPVRLLDHLCIGETVSYFVQKQFIKHRLKQVKSKGIT